MHIFSVYIVGGIELCSQLYFFLSYLKKSLRPLNLFFSGLLTFSVMWLSYGIVCSLTCMVHPFLFSLFSARAGIMCSILGDVLTLFLSLACYFFILKYFTPEEKKEDKYVMLFLLPVFLIFLLVEYIRREIYGNTILTDSGGNVLNAHHGQMLMLQVLAMASLVCVLMGYKKLEENFRLGRELALLTQAESYLRQYVTEAKMHEEGKKKVFFDDPKKSETKGEEKCTTDTSQVDREIRKLKEEVKHLKQQIKNADPEEKKRLEQRLAQAEMELSQKDNDSYRKQNAKIS